MWAQYWYELDLVSPKSAKAFNTKKKEPLGSKNTVYEKFRGKNFGFSDMYPSQRFTSSSIWGNCCESKADPLLILKDPGLLKSTIVKSQNIA